MYTEDEKIGFSNAAESLKKYRRAEIVCRFITWKCCIREMYER